MQVLLRMDFLLLCLCNFCLQLVVASKSEVLNVFRPEAPLQNFSDLAAPHLKWIYYEYYNINNIIWLLITMLLLLSPGTVRDRAWGCLASRGKVLGYTLRMWEVVRGWEGQGLGKKAHKAWEGRGACPGDAVVQSLQPLQQTGWHILHAFCRARLRISCGRSACFCRSPSQTDPAWCRPERGIKGSWNCPLNLGFQEVH